MPLPHTLHLQLPEWFQAFGRRATARRYGGDRSAMDLVLEPTELNLHHGGGPLGAAVLADGKLLSLAVIRDVPDRSRLWHAELVAIALAHRACDSHRLGARSLTLASSCEPSCMCLAALPWSGISDLVTGARAADGRELGFDAGPKPVDWEAACS